MVEAALSNMAMPHRVVCPHCAKPLGIEERLLGTDGACPHCQRAFLAPELPAVQKLRSFACPVCGHGFQVVWPTATLQVDCPTCQQAVRLSVGQENVREGEPPPRIVTEGLSEVGSLEPAGESIDIPTEDGGIVTVCQPVKTVRKGSRTVALRRLSPEEKRRRRAFHNVVFFVVGASFLALALTVLQRIAK